VRGWLRGLSLALACLLLTADPAAVGAAAGAGDPSAPLPVVTSSTDLRALVEAVAGDRVRVESLAPPLADPHAVAIKPGLLQKLRGASLLVRIGLDHEPWLDQLLRSLDDRRFVRASPHYLDTSRGIALLQAETPRVKGERGVHVHGFGNTHYWLDPENARPITAGILEALARLAPADRARFEANRTRFAAELTARIVRWEQAMAPHRGAKVVVVHETWPYFAWRFGLTVVAAVEPTPGVPPSPSALAALTQRMRESGIKLLIAEPYSHMAVVNQVAARSGARVVTLIPSVGGDPEARDYFALFELNIRRLVDALSR
jgi:ABC-type Zn uptake system ZnuABC Zn-binding protein ZnuA